MPVASSSRRNTARRPPSEDIEEANSTQPAPDEEMDEGDSQSRRIAKVKKEKTKIHKGQAKQEIKNSGSYNEDDDRIDVANFQDQPLGRADLTKLKGMAGDWGNIRQSVQTQSLNLVADIARSVAEYANGEDKEKELAELEGIMKEMIDLEEEMLCHEKVVDEIYQLVAQEEAIDDAVSRYQDGAKLKMAIYGKKTTRQKYAKSERFATFKQGIYEADHPGGAMPPLTEFIPREPGDESDDDDDLEIGGVTQDYKCPITLTHLNNPYTSFVLGFLHHIHMTSRFVMTVLSANIRSPVKPSESSLVADLRLRENVLLQSGSFRIGAGLRRTDKSHQSISRTIIWKTGASEFDQ